MWDIRLGSPLLHKIKGHEGPAGSLVIRPEEDLIVTGGDDRRVTLYSPYSEYGLESVRMDELQLGVR